jgi:toxin ParE1/3/4
VPKYELTETADADLSDIYSFTFTEFGERQADAYFESLEDCLMRLAGSPQLGREIGFLRKGYRLFVHQRHSIYYKPAKSGILVVRVLGPGMNPDAHLR